MPQIDINIPGRPGLPPDLDIDKVPSIRDIGKKKDRDEDSKKQPPKSPCPYCGGFH